MPLLEMLKCPRTPNREPLGQAIACLFQLRELCAEIFHAFPMLVHNWRRCAINKEFVF